MQPGSLSQLPDRGASHAPNAALPNIFGTLIALLTLSFPLMLISQPPTPPRTSQSFTHTIPHTPVAKISTQVPQD